MQRIRIKIEALDADLSWSPRYVYETQADLTGKMLERLTDKIHQGIEPPKARGIHAKGKDDVGSTETPGD